jgi:hypothetical protein
MPFGDSPENSAGNHEAVLHWYSIKNMLFSDPHKQGVFYHRKSTPCNLCSLFSMLSQLPKLDVAGSSPVSRSSRKQASPITYGFPKLLGSLKTHLGLNAVADPLQIGPDKGYELGREEVSFIGLR